MLSMLSRHGRATPLVWLSVDKVSTAVPFQAIVAE
jgi:hypothetical protein